MLPTLGIDISKDSFHLELLVNEKLRHRKFANRKEGFAELCVWLAKHKTTQVHACLEATVLTAKTWPFISISRAI